MADSDLDSGADNEALDREVTYGARGGAGNGVGSRIPAPVDIFAQLVKINEGREDIDFDSIPVRITTPGAHVAQDNVTQGAVALRRSVARAEVTAADGDGMVVDDEAAVVDSIRDHITTENTAGWRNEQDDAPFIFLDGTDSSLQGDLADNSRYFVEESKRGIICLFCRKPGHKARNCTEKEVQCYVCSENHDPMRCPMYEVCFRCWRRGHQSAECPETSVPRRSLCDYCDGMHATMECPYVWRHYRYVMADDPPSRDQNSTGGRDRGSGRRDRGQNNAIYCYNCGQAGHFGDDCPKMSSHRNAGKPSAFCNASLRYDPVRQRHDDGPSASHSANNVRQHRRSPPVLHYNERGVSPQRAGYRDNRQQNYNNNNYNNRQHMRDDDVRSELNPSNRPPRKRRHRRAGGN